MRTVKGDLASGSKSLAAVVTPKAQDIVLSSLPSLEQMAPEPVYVV